MSSFSSAELDEQKVKATEEGPEATLQEDEEEGLPTRNKAVKTSKELQLKRKIARDMDIKSNKTMRNILAPQESGPTKETEKKSRKTRKGDKE